MGGHGGLNILPQKRWNVYNRDNRLKVARDEAQYEAEQAEKQARAAEADAERRRLLLKERARQRYGREQQALPGAEAPPAALEWHTDELSKADEQQQWQQAQPADDWQADATAIRGFAAGQADHFAALEQQLGGQQQAQQQQAQQRHERAPATDEADERSSKRRRRQDREASRGAASGPAPSLAELAKQLDSPAEPRRNGRAAAAAQQPGTAADAMAAEQQVQERGAGGVAGGALVGAYGGAPGAPPQRFSLFADEEAVAAKRANPEAEAEKRDERRRRGAADTQTSDARFDEQFAFAHKLYGSQAVPWYAKRGSTLPAQGDEAADQQPERPLSGRRQMWEWEMQARAALAGSAQQAQQAGHGGERQLLEGVKVVRSGGRRASPSSGSSSSSSSSGSSSSESSGSSSSESSSDSDSGGRKRRYRDNKHKSRSGKRQSKSKRRNGKRSRSCSGKRKSSKSSGTKSVEQLRLERLQREDAERQRQARLLAVAAGRDPALGGKKYYGGYGFGRA